MNQNECLAAVVLPAGTPVLEYQPCEESASSDRREVERRIHDIYTSDHGRAFLSLGLIDRSLRFSPSLEYWRDLSASFVHEVLVDPQVDEKRENVHVDMHAGEEAAALCGRVPPMVGAELVDEVVIAKFRELLHQAFQREVAGRAGPVEEILRALSPGSGLLAHRIHFHLVENRRDDKSPFAFLATYSADIGTEGTLRHLPLSNALKEFEKDTRKLVSLLSSIHKAAAASSLIKPLLESGEVFHPLRFTAGEAYKFLSEVPLYEQSGILCRIPRWWSAAPRKISVGLSIGDRAGGKLGAEALLGFTPLLHIGGEKISPEEAQRILSNYDGLALIKGKWTVVDRESLQKNLVLFDKARQLSGKMQVTFAEAVRMLLGMERPSLDGREQWSGDVVCGDWLAQVLEKLRSPAALEPVPPPRDLAARLRPYQQAGLNWLSFLHDLGFGACLADDMGLGKTVQVLALLQSCKERGEQDYGPSLLIVPASLIDNWLTEIRRFTPSLRAFVAHPQYADTAALQEISCNTGLWDIVITTYTMSRKLAWIAKRGWYHLILDEAQAIKNQAAAQTRAVKQIPALHRIIMTGTPIENRLGDLWSLFDFTNRGLLGSAQGFKRFAKSLEERPEGYARLRQVIQPYILRRLKTDRSVITDLPEKIEMKAWTSLSRKQVVLYKGLVDDLADALAGTEGIKRKGLILSFLLKFKQVCNHPDQLAGAWPFLEEDSGKMQRLRELCEEIHEKRERVLIFTQFREMVGPLDDFCKTVFGKPGVQLHGGTPVSKRKERVEIFQNEDEYVPYFVLSVKAGGVGLNLTAANHVVHFDRWWNPAVERQAEDRAFRIGQKRAVVVHPFVCKGTVEEKIDEMIESKKELSEKVLSAGTESWITEMSNEQIRDMFKLTLTGVV